MKHSNEKQLRPAKLIFTEYNKQQYNIMLMVNFFDI